ncbi:MAG: hypothetical protein JKP98_06280 [Rhodobacteraceae bacterium]|nr:hypothetical protein [Paracoccaceae bacterium]
MAIDAAMADRAAMAALLLLGVVLPLMLVGLVLRVMRRNRHLIAPDPTDAADPLPCPTCGAPMPAGAVLLGRGRTGRRTAPHGPGRWPLFLARCPTRCPWRCRPHSTGHGIARDAGFWSSITAPWSQRPASRPPARHRGPWLSDDRRVQRDRRADPARQAQSAVPLALAGIAMAAFLAAIPATRLLFHRLLARA